MPRDPHGALTMARAAATTSPAPPPAPSLSTGLRPDRTRRLDRAWPAPDSYVVRPGDSLWSIAAAQLGDGDDWPAIAALNLGRTMADGLQFVDPNTIHSRLDPRAARPGDAPVPDDSAGRPAVAAHPPARPTRPLPSSLSPKRWLPVTSHVDASRSDDAPTLPFQDEALLLTAYRVARRGRDPAVWTCPSWPPSGSALSPALR